MVSGEVIRWKEEKPEMEEAATTSASLDPATNQDVGSDVKGLLG